MTELNHEPDVEIRVIVAGGGTGGHLFPGMAVAQEIRRRYQKANILFVTGRRRMESEILARSGLRQVSIPVEGLKGRGVRKGIATILKLPMSLLQSIFIMSKFAPHIVLGVGGYSAGPVCLAARIMGIPSAIHEQNSFPGLTNRLLCRVVDRVLISFDESRAHFPGGKLFFSGNPIREEILKARRRGETEPKAFTVLVVGGSQGARSINRAFVSALEILKGKARPPRVLHQTGQADYEEVLEAYRQMKLQGDVRPFIRNMADAYRQADIVVSRAGASTVSELAALGKPSILIPYPYAANRHQETNARVLVEVGGAEMLLQKDLSGESLAGLLTKHMDNRKELQDMGERAGGKGRDDAARVIVNHLVEMLN
jgi:UDP-N-acetylglucosamine--N-acetylmuramyl-(pentapeptide) pyrophosphoryl-undecaprenol N-acetylglucosamine transferase